MSPAPSTRGSYRSCSRSSSSSSNIQQQSSNNHVDGYVWLDGDHRPGLGAILYQALAQQSAVIGVAKTSFGDASWCIPVVRGESQRPLFVSAVGMDAEEAAKGLQAMHGRHRIPTLLQLVDREARAALR